MTQNYLDCFKIADSTFAFYEYSPCASITIREQISNIIKKSLYPNGKCDPELERIGKLYISEGIEVLLEDEKNNCINKTPELDIKKMLEENGYTFDYGGNYKFGRLLGMIEGNLEKNLNTILIPSDLIPNSPKENGQYSIYVKDPKKEK